MSGFLNLSPRQYFRLLRSLEKPKACLYALNEEQKWGVFLHGDRRRRPLEVIVEADMQALRAEGNLTALEDGGYVLSCEGKINLERMRKDKQDFSSQHRLLEEVDMIEDDGKLIKRTVNLAESPLGWLRRRGGAQGKPYLEDHEYTAGERLREDYWRSDLSSRISGSIWDKQGTGSKGYHTEAFQNASASALDAKKRLLKALDAVGYPLNRVLVGACLREQGLDALEQAERWPRRSAKIILKLALGRLAHHYGYGPHGRQDRYGFEGG